MAQALTGPLAPGIVLSNGYIVRVTAVNPTTGATVTGVKISNVAMQVDTIDSEEEAPTVAAVPPLFVYGTSE